MPAEAWLLAQTPLPSVPPAGNPENDSFAAPLAIWGTGRSNDLKLSPNGRLLAIGTGIGGFLYDSLSLEMLTVFQTPRAVLEIAFSSDSQLIALGQAGRIIDIYLLEGYELIARLQAPPETTAENIKPSLHFIKDDQQLVWTSAIQRDLFITTWNTADWSLTTDFSIEKSLAYFSNPDLEILGVLSDETINLQSLSDPQESERRTLPQPDDTAFWEPFDYYEAEIVSANDNAFILISNGLSILRWDTDEDSYTYEIGPYPDDQSTPCTQASETCLNVNGQIAWDCPDGPGNPPIQLIQLTPDDIMILISLESGRTEFRRASDGLLAWEIETAYVDVIFSPGGEFFIGVLPNGTIEKRASLDGQMIAFWKLHPSQIYDIAFSPQGDILAGAYGDGWIRIYSTQNGQFLGILTGLARSLDFSPDGQLLAAGLTDGNVRIFELAAGTYQDLPKRHQDAVQDLDFSADGTLLLTGSDDCTSRLWQVENSFQIHQINPGAENPFRIANVLLQIPGPLQYFSGNRNGIYLYENTSPLPVFFTNLYGPTDMAISPNGEWLALTGAETWLIPPPAYNPLVDPIQLSEMPGSPDLGIGYALAFSPDGQLLVTASIEYLNIWSLMPVFHQGQTRIYDQTLPNAQPVALRISPDNRLIAMATYDGLIRVYMLPENTEN